MGFMIPGTPYSFLFVCRKCITDTMARKTKCNDDVSYPFSHYDPIYKLRRCHRFKVGVVNFSSRSEYMFNV